VQPAAKHPQTARIQVMDVQQARLALDVVGEKMMIGVIATTTKGRAARIMHVALTIVVCTKTGKAAELNTMVQDVQLARLDLDAVWEKIAIGAIETTVREHAAKIMRVARMIVA